MRPANYARPVSICSVPGSPAVSTFSNGQQFKHARTCPAGPGLGFAGCECYVSRLRYTKTDLGELLLTPEPDPKQMQLALEHERLATRHWHTRADRLGIAAAIATVLLLVCMTLHGTGVL